MCDHKWINWFQGSKKCVQCKEIRKGGKIVRNGRSS